MASETAEKDKKEIINNYQICTLRVLEEVLRWKEDT